MPKLNPLLESDNIECAHQGKIVASSNNKLLEVDGSCVLTKQDLLQAKIIGCNHQVAGFSTPCKAIVKIVDSALSNTLSINGDSSIIAQQISQIFTDNGVPLQFKNGATPKAKDIFELDEDIAEDFNDLQNSNGNAESTSQSNPKSNEFNTKSSVESNKDSNNSQSMQDSQTNTNEDKKSEIDLRGQTTPNGGKVEWISQFDDKVKKKYGKSGCNAVSRLILRKSGLGENSGADSNTYILAQEKGRELKTEIYGTNLRHNKFIKTADGQIDTTQQQSYLKISSSNTLKEAISYLDSELEKGYPIMIGVDHTYDKRLNETKDDIDGKRYNEYTTDHFVVIVGRGYDKQGNLYYLFYEVGTSDEDKGKNDNNKLYIKNGMLQGITQSTFKNYVVTQVRRNQHKS